MAVIQEYDDGILPQGGIAGGASPENMGASMARAVSNLGASFGDVAKAQYSLANDMGRLQAGMDVEKAQRNAQAWYAEQKAKLDPINDPEYADKLQGLQGQFRDYMDQQRQAYAGSSSNRIYERMFNAHFNTLAMRMDTAVREDIAQSAGAAVSTQAVALARFKLDNIRQNPSEENVTQVIDSYKQTIGTISVPGFTDKHKIEAVNQFVNQAADAAFSARAARDPYGMFGALGIQGAAYGKYGPRGGSYTQNPGAAYAPPNGFGTPNIPVSAARWAGVAATAGSKYGVDPNFLVAQINAESGGNPSAITTKTATGKPSVGVSQFQPDTAAQYGVDASNPRSSIDGQARYMSDLLKQFGGDYMKATAAYNWGQGNVAAAVQKYGDDWVSHAPTATKDYLAKIFNSLPNANSGQPGNGAADTQMVDVPDSAFLKSGPGMGELWSYLTDAQRVRVGRLAEQGIRADQIAKAQNLALQAQQLKQQQAQVENLYLDKLIDGKLTVDDIRQDTVLTAAQREHWYNALNSQVAKQDKTDPTIFNNLFQRIHLPDGDKNKITDPDQLSPFMGNGVSFSDLGKLRGELAGKGQAGSELLKNFKDMAKSQISGSSLIAKDPDGDKMFYNWNAYVDSVIAQKQKAGVSLHDMLTPGNKDYLGPTINGFVRSPKQQINDMAKRMQGGSAAPLPPDKMRKPGESIDDWMKRTGGK